MKKYYWKNKMSSSLAYILSLTLLSGIANAESSLYPKNDELILTNLKLERKDVSSQKDTGWIWLFNGQKDIDGKWKGINGNLPSDVWKVDDGLLYVDGHKKGGDIITKEKFKNFILEFDFNLTENANSGIKYLVNKIENHKVKKYFWNGPEYQIIDDFNSVYVKDDPNGTGSTGAFYLIYEPHGKKLNPPGEWNHGKILVRDGHVEHWLNGSKIVDGQIGSDEYRKRISSTKFASYGRYGEVQSGHIMLTDHDGDKVCFRNIKIKKLK